jgi:hypothetical protein
MILGLPRRLYSYQNATRSGWGVYSGGDGPKDIRPRIGLSNASVILRMLISAHVTDQ